MEATRLSAIPFTEVRLSDSFWAPRLETNRVVTVPHNLDCCESTGRLRNFEIAGRLAESEFEGV